MGIQIIGWLASIIVLAGYFLNARQYYKYALGIWVLGDLFYIIYNYLIFNWPHLILNLIIININIFGFYKLNNAKKISNN